MTPLKLGQALACIKAEQENELDLHINGLNNPENRQYIEKVRNKFKQVAGSISGLVNLSTFEQERFIDSSENRMALYLNIFLMDNSSEESVLYTRLLNLNLSTFEEFSHILNDYVTMFEKLRENKV